MSIRITLLGAGGKMGCRITDRLRGDDAYDVEYVEPGSEGRRRLDERDITPTPQEEALEDAEIVVMAVPDEVLGDVSQEVVPALQPGTMVVLLDPAAAYAGVLCQREDLTYFVTHPCHPSFFTAETRMNEDDPDWFGGQGRDPQDIVCALHSGPESAYARGEALARDVYAPVRRAHRLTTEQMAILEPALAETVTITFVEAIREALEEAVAMGVPEQAARDFLFGHLRIDVGITFGLTDFPYSDGALEAVETAKAELLEPDWKESVFDVEAIEKSTRDIATPEEY